MSSTSDTITVTVVWSATGQSESLPLSGGTKLEELAGWCKALFGVADTAIINLFKEGKPLLTSFTLQQAGICHGDLIAASQQLSAAEVAARSRPTSQQQAAAAATTGGGLDFSNLLSSAGAGASSSGGNIIGSAPISASASSAPPAPVYYPGMHLQDAMDYNPHPVPFINLLKTHEHLFKEFRYHNGSLANRLKVESTEKAVEIWKEEMVSNSIKGAVRATDKFHKENEMTTRRKNNPNDPEAIEYFRKKDSEARIQQQYFEMMQEYPESLGSVLMLYVKAKINGKEIQAFCDSGAQSTIMSKKVATECGLVDLIDTRFAGMAVGVGTGKILGRIHIVQLQIGDDMFFPCTVTVMDDPGEGAKEMPFLLGLDMMKRHLCQIDLENQCLRFRLGPGEHKSTPFLHEKDLEESQGGTKGFNADKANQRLMELEQKEKDNKNGMDESK